MPRLSNPCPRKAEQGALKDGHEALQLEVDEGGRKARRGKAGGGKERVRVLRLVRVQGRVEHPGVGREMGRRGRRATRSDSPPEAPAILLGQLREQVVGVPHEDRAVLEEIVRSGRSRREDRARDRGNLSPQIASVFA